MDTDVPLLQCPRIADCRHSLDDLLVSGLGGASVPLVDAVSGTPLPPAVRASVETAWTDERLLVLFTCVEEHVWATHTARDAPLYDEEVVEVFLAPTGDVRHYYELEVSPANVLFDARVKSPDLDRKTMQVETDWTCAGLETRAHVDGTLRRTVPTHGEPPSAAGWRAALSIPFAAFPEVSAPRPGDRWRANFYRIERGREVSYAAWSPTMERPANFHVPARFGVLCFQG